MSKIKKIKCFFKGHNYLYEEIILGSSYLKMYMPTKTLYARCDNCKKWDIDNRKIIFNDNFKNLYSQQI